MEVKGSRVPSEQLTYFHDLLGVRFGEQLLGCLSKLLDLKLNGCQLFRVMNAEVMEGGRGGGIITFPCHVAILYVT